MSFNNPIRFFRDSAAEQAALNAQIQITNQLQNQTNTELAEGRDLANELRNAWRGIGAEISGIIKDEMKKLDGAAKDVARSIEKDINKEIKKQEQSTKDITKLLEKQKNGSLKSAEIESKIASAKQRQLSIEDLLLEAKSEGIYSEEKRAEIIEETNNRFKIQNKLLKEALAKAEEFEKKLGITYKIFDGIEKIPILNALIKIDKVKDAMEAAAGKQKSIWKVFGAGVSATFSQIGKSLKDPLVLLTAQVALIKKFFDAYSEVNKRIVDQQKQLGISYEASDKLRKSAQEYAESQRNAFVTEARISEGRHKLNEALGTSIAFTDKEAITAEKLEHYYGLSAEQNGRLAEFGREIGQTNDGILNTIIRTTNEQKRQFGGSIQYQKVAQKVSGISGDILTKFKGNVKALTEAVVQADRLGLTLDQVSKISESLLNFEQSIESELKAELLTGKAINMEKARAAALSGDQAKLMNEIASQVGSIHEFEKMNTIQRKAYAEAFGMEVGEMGNMLRKKELEAKLGVDISKSATEALELANKKGITIDESIRKELEAKSLAELQKYTFEKIKSILTKIAEGPMKTIYKLLEKGLKFAESIFGVFGKMTGGTLGNALGAAVLGAPLLLGAVRLAMGSAKALFFNGMSPATAPWVKVAGGMGMGGGMNIGGTQLNSRGGAGFFTDYRALRGAGVSRREAFSMSGQANPMGRNLAIGGGLALGGMALSGIASGMDEGAGKNAVGVLGQTAAYAGMGMMFGPYGAAIGGLVGLGMGLFSLSKENEERRKAEAEKKKEEDKKYQDMVEALSVRPLQLNVGNESLATFSTRQSLTNAPSNFA